MNTEVNEGTERQDARGVAHGDREDTDVRDIPRRRDTPREGTRNKKDRDDRAEQWGEGILGGAGGEGDFTRVRDLGAFEGGGSDGSSAHADLPRVREARREIKVHDHANLTRRRAREECRPPA